MTEHTLDEFEPMLEKFGEFEEMPFVDTLPRDQQQSERTFLPTAQTERHLADWTNRECFTDTAIKHNTENSSTEVPEADFKPYFEPYTEAGSGAPASNTPGSTWPTEEIVPSTHPQAEVDTPDPITPKRELTIDELIERWINDDADAPIPAELFVTS